MLVEGLIVYYYPSCTQAKGRDLMGEVARTCAHIIDAVKYITDQQRYIH